MSILNLLYSLFQQTKMMYNKSIKYTEWALTGVFALATALFFAFPYRYHLYFHEQNQLLLLTWDYFLKAISVPGGFSDWLGEFIVQFFRLVYPAALILGIFMAKIQVFSSKLISRFSGRDDILGWVIGFIPAVLVLIHLASDNAIVGGGVAFLMSISILYACTKVEEDRVRRIVGIASVVAAYWLAGPLALLNAVGVLSYEILVRRSKCPVFIVSVVALAVLSPVVSHLFVPVRYPEFFYGLHYDRLPGEVAWWLWAADFSLCLIMVLSALSTYVKPMGAKLNHVISVALLALVCVCGASGLRSVRNDIMERTFMYDKMYVDADYDSIIKEYAEELPVDAYSAPVYNNLAMAQKGLLLEDMFTVPQRGIDGLLPEYEGGFFSQIACAEVLFQIGFASSAHRLFFEAQESVPDYRKTARCYKALARTNIVMGYESAARKYLDALSHTLFYRHWAKETLALLGDEKAISEHPIYGPLKRRLPRGFDMLFNVDNLTRPLGLLCVENNTNVIAVQYLMAYSLLNGDLNSFAAFYNSASFREHPRACQEAAAMIPGYPKATEAAVKRFRQFNLDIQQKKDASYMKRTYGDSYWYYYSMMQARNAKKQN